jgi:hypothetical protein
MFRWTRIDGQLARGKWRNQEPRWGGAKHSELY